VAHGAPARRRLGAVPLDPSLHRALADEGRRRIVDELRDASAGLDAHELAERLDLHANTVRWHLGILADAGLIDSEPARNAGRGRPRTVYSLTQDARARDGDEHRLLASVLSGAMARMVGGAEAAVDAGRAWGRYLVRRPLPLAPVNESDAVAEVVSVLDTQGFDPEVDGREILMRRCPFRDLAATHPGVVCGMHGGLIAGALDELGGRLDLEELRPFVEPGLCVARLASHDS
jgi:predicted ArsR family transcriptional regulator